MTRWRTATVVLAAGAAVLLTAASLLALALLGPTRGGRGPAPPCAAPALSGTTVHVALTDRGGMMGGPMMAGAARVTADRTIVPHGKVSFAATNTGRLPHELVVLPLPTGQPAGERTTGADGRVDETGALGEASAACADGAGAGIPPGASSWTTLQLPPGRYELICNYPGHYLAGMHTMLEVT
ncbi:sulfocyanin-like copper-binding protein [Cumulibacter manganitolerans]|uniref:sulfocyanin-like copper-binding protein n=1 Tax=Cumulibacter manganitolerans TaxID=1884992 RepID=UPI0012960D58|nr:sulfocyanin-like copper-binding protein [Cumulibacter manganitolerans]